jgi:hypothetical protein
VSTCWVGWWKTRGRWQRLTGPHATIAEAHGALDAEVRRRGIRARSTDLVVTTGNPPDLARVQPPLTDRTPGGSEDG